MGEGIQDAVLFLAVTSFHAGIRRGLGCHAVSVRHLLDHYDAPWAGFRPGRECQPLQPPQRWWETKRCLNAPFPPPVAGAINSGYRTGVRLKERSTPTAGLVSNDRGTNVKPRPEDWTEDGGLEHSAGSTRAASGEQSQIRSGSIPSWATLPESESNPSGHTRATGIVPPRFLWRETSEKPDNAISITRPHPAGLVPGRAIAQIVHSSS